MSVRVSTGQSPNSVLMLGQRLIQLTGIEPAMGCDAGPTLNRYWVDGPTLCEPSTCIDSYTDLSVDVTERSACSGVSHTAQYGCWPAPAMALEGISR